MTHSHSVPEAGVGILVLVLAWLAYGLVWGLVRGGRRFAPLSRQSLGVRVPLALLSVLLALFPSRAPRPERA